MKVLFVFVCVFVSGCATGITSSVSGDQTKNGGPMRFERLGAMTSEDISPRRQCGMRQVSMCTTSDSREVCDCLSVKDAEFRVRQVVRQHRGPGI